MIYGNSVGGIGIERTYILMDEKGTELPATFVDTNTNFDATANDIRLGKTAATEIGVVVGEKDIPPYYTAEGRRVVTNGSRFFVPSVYYDYTKLQAIICPFNTSASNSVAAEKVVIENHVYPVQSTVAEYDIVKDADNAWIDFGFTNESGTIYLIRYFLYKEIY